MPRFGMVPFDVLDFDAAARDITGLDLAIVIDSASAHLCGSIGVPTWLLLHKPVFDGGIVRASTVGYMSDLLTDWRWGTEGETTPWYPSMKIYRQSRETAGDWGPVVARIAAVLAA